MVAVYAVALTAAVVALVAWIFLHTYAGIVGRPSLDPEVRLTGRGRATLAAVLGFGLAGMSAEFSPRDLSWPVALALAVAGGAGLAWYARWIDRGEPPVGPGGTTGD